MTPSISISESEKNILLTLARQTLNGYITTNKLPDQSHIINQLNTSRHEKMGVFVTLSKQQHLRGCIGCIQSNRPIMQEVIVQTINAAINDDRFPTVTASELADIQIEITLLTPPKAIQSYTEIEIGKHGIILQKQTRRSLFLPQVPTEFNWDLNTTLTHLAKKAGLPPDAWKQNCEFFIFEGIKFRESSSN